ncbi:ABC transporter permease [Saccharopolyspora sp. NPDC050642]|uniref:ABC transporter permease n=1 Tax=Saccharopolyspora sp. NPDC050642 TaxID=3157099 RepID=UPI0033FBEEB0
MINTLDARTRTGPSASPRQRGRTWRRLVRRPSVLLAMAFLLLLCAVAVFGPLLMTHDPNQQSLRESFGSISAAHWLGTDDLGRDVYSRIIVATRLTVIAPLIAVGVAVLIGLPTGLLAGYSGGWIDWALSRVADTLLSLPPIVLAVTIVAVIGPNLVNAMVGIGIVYAPRLFRVVRGSVLSVREELFVESARSIGCSTSRTLFSHVLPNVSTPLLVQVTLMMGFALLAEASLSFLGLAVQPPDASWGAMLRTAYEHQFRAPYAVVAPGVLLTLTILSFNIVGDGIRDAVAGRRTR